MDIGLAIFGGAILATAGWVFGQRQNRKLTRIEHTFRILDKYRDDDAHWKAIERFVGMAKRDDLPTPDDDHRAEDIAALRKLLTHYEYIAAGIFVGGIDEQIVRECDRGNIVNLSQYGMDYIRRVRESRGRQTIYRNLTDLGKRWQRPPSPVHIQLIEYIRMRPNRPKRVSGSRR